MPTDLLTAARGGDFRAVGRLISMIEGSDALAREAMAMLATAGPLPAAQVIGLTGAPGVGKSTTTSALVAAYRARGSVIGVLAIDPSSPFSGGALLGDRIRMQEHATDTGVFVRSMASRGQLGGLARSTPQAIRVLAAAGCEVVLVETVGVGQAELDIAALADTTLVLLAPGMGDGIQAAKAGILEIADVLVVNKADRDGAGATARELRQMVALGARAAGEWAPPVLTTVAAKGEGIEELVAAVAKHRDWLATSGAGEQRRLARAAAEVEQIALGTLRARITGLRDGAGLAQLAADVLGGILDPFAAADRLIAEL